jgi:hypothetical protein
MSTPTYLELCDKATPGKRRVEDPMGPEVLSVVVGDSPCPADWKFIADCHMQPEKDESRIPANEQEANAQLIARMSPEVCRKIYRALKVARNITAGDVTCRQMEEALALLDGKDTPQDGK